MLVNFSIIIFEFINLIDVQMQKKFDTNQSQCSQLLLHNQELKIKCDLLQEKLDNLERNNIRLIQRSTQQVKFLVFIKRKTKTKMTLFVFLFKGSSFTC
jgi:hypothetical protein